MAHILYSASAPGTLMLFGEHAVLNDKKAMVLSINQRIRVTLQPRSDDQVLILSALGEKQVSLQHLRSEKPFQFVLSAILQVKEQLPSGFDLSIVSTFSDEVGLGSSAAVTVAVLAALDQWIHKNSALSEKTQFRLFETARQVIRGVQGVGSGADVAASVFGGLMVYQQEPPYLLKKLDVLLPLVVLYSGSKTPTAEVVKIVNERQRKYPAIFEALYTAMDGIVEKAIPLIDSEDWKALGELMNIQQGLLNALGVGTVRLTQCIDYLNSDPHLFGAKISGSGLGDCVIGLGQCSAPFQKGHALMRLLSVTASTQGVRYE